MNVRVSTRSVVVVLFAVVVLLGIANVVSDAAAYLSESDDVYPLFNLGLDANVPTWYSSFSILLCSAVMLVIYLGKRRDGGEYRRRWAGLAAIFLLMSVDEVARIHETVTEALGAAIVSQFPSVTPDSPLFYSTWMIPVALMMIALAVLYFRFVLDLPRRTRLLFVAAGVVYVSGAMGMEAVGDVITALSGGDVSSMVGRVALALATLLEETLEMLGILVFFYALLDYATKSIGSITLYFGK